MSVLDEEEEIPVDKDGRPRICTCSFVEAEHEKEEVDQIHVNIEKTESAEAKDHNMSVEGKIFNSALGKNHLSDYTDL